MASKIPERINLLDEVYELKELIPAKRKEDFKIKWALRGHKVYFKSNPLRKSQFYAYTTVNSNEEVREKALLISRTLYPCNSSGKFRGTDKLIEKKNSKS